MINLVAKFLKIKYPLVAAVFATVAYDYVIHYYTDAPKGHWFSTSSDSYNLSIFIHFITLLDKIINSHLALDQKIIYLIR